MSRLTYEVAEAPGGIAITATVVSFIDPTPRPVPSREELIGASGSSSDSFSTAVSGMW